MITRVWHGLTKKENAEKYRDYVTETGVSDYLATNGNVDVQIWQKDEDETTHIYTVTRWDNLDAVKEFAGEDYGKAKYYPEDEEYLLEFEPDVKHYDSYTFSKNKIRYYVQQLEEVYRGGNWNAESFLGKLTAIDEEIAFTQPLPGTHSVAEILWHTIYWRTVILKRIGGDYEYGEQTENEQNFLPLETLKEKGWAELLVELRDIQEELLKAIKARDDNFLKKEFQSGTSVDRELEGLILHDTYHLGQIGLVISMLVNQRKAEKVSTL